MTWEVAAVTIKGPKGEWKIPAWRSEFFALDWRPICNESTADYVDAFGAWAVTHLPTGYSAGAIVGTFASASRFADELTKAADWDFDDPASAPQRAEAVKNVIARTGVVRINGGHVQLPNGGAA